MRLTEEQVRQGFQHPDKRVRDAVLTYFSKASRPDPNIMLDVIEAIERRGLRDAFSYTFPITELALSEASIQWVMQRLRQLPSNPQEANFTNGLSQLILNADPDLLLPREAEILALPSLEPIFATRLERILQMHTTPPEPLWDQLLDHCKEGKHCEWVEDFPFNEVVDVAQALGRLPSQADRVLELLAVEFDADEHPELVWLEGFLVRIAGLLRLEAAIPLIFQKFQFDGDLLNQECDSALVRIGTERVVREVRDNFSNSPRQFRIYTSSVFRSIHSDFAVSSGLELLQSESDELVRGLLALALVEQFSTEAIEAARSIVTESHDLDIDLIFSLVAACKLTGHAPPELPQWEAEIATPRRKRFHGQIMDLDDSRNHDAKLVQDFYNSMDEPRDDSYEAEPVRIESRVGRNDPCPCGSGKKFKKCCIHKAETTPL